MHWVSSARAWILRECWEGGQKVGPWEQEADQDPAIMTILAPFPGSAEQLQAAAQICTNLSSGANLSRPFEADMALPRGGGKYLLALG